MWWKQAVVYQIYPKSFYDTNGDGIGDIKGIIHKLPYLHDLGINVIWLCPVYPSPQKDNGYDISNYYGIHETFGTLDDMKTLIKEAKVLDIHIMMDIVANHTSSEHQWFKEALKDEMSPYRDYYVFRKSASGPPSDLQSIFLNSAWTYHEPTDSYYLHLFDPDQPDLNWHHKPVRKEIYDILRFWIDLGIKGFRFDVIDLIAKEIDQNSIGDGPKLHDYIKEMNQAAFKGHDLITVGETWGATPEKSKLYSNPDQSEFSMIFNFQHSLLDQEEGKEKWDLKPLNLMDLKKVFEEQQTTLYNQGWNSLFWNNHDLPRIVSRWGNDQTYRVESAKMLATLLHFMQGTPYIYQGEEIGMTNCKFDMNEYQDVETINMISDRLKKGFDMKDIIKSIETKGRDNARTPMQWNDQAYAGFSDVKPWIKVNPNYKDIHVASNLSEPNSVFNYYKKLIHFRRHSEYQDIIKHGKFIMTYKDHPSIFAYDRVTDDMRLKVICNFYGEQITLDEPISTDGNIVIHNYQNVSPQISVLRPYEAIAIAYRAKI